ncbi:hypothetical protein BKI52_41000 [marine bacterium AO1-C]|nr:hypothetical protein BKI52_41000 [marine bacterium AO1-C]
MSNFIKKYKLYLIKLLALPYRIGSSILVVGLLWGLLGYGVQQYIINQEVFVFFAATGLLWMVGNAAYFTSEFTLWKKHLGSVGLFFGLYFMGLYWLTRSLQTVDVYNAKLMGWQLILLGLGSGLVGLIELIFRFSTSSTPNKSI